MQINIKNTSDTIYIKNIIKSTVYKKQILIKKKLKS